MPFRANEEITNGRRDALAKLLGRSIEPNRLERSTKDLHELLDRYGPVVQAYPSWHPLVCDKPDHRSPETLPSDRSGYRGLDHTVYLRGGFITCPYGGGDDVLKSVDEISRRDATKGVAHISAEKIDAQLYHPGATPILVTCEWQRPLNRDGTIPTALAIPLLLERELPCWRDAEVAENWKTMAPYILGRPYGSRSSLFVNEETGQALKAFWNHLINTGMFGPIRVGSW